MCFKMSPKKSKYHVSVEVKNHIAGFRQAGKSYPEFHKILKSEKVEIPLSTIQRIGRTFLLTGSVARKVGSGRPRVTTS